MEAFLKTGKLGAQAISSNVSREKTGKETRLQPWVEKYRPKKIVDVASQEEVVAVLKKCLEGADLPNFLFYGPPGTGKTSTILAAARELFGDLYKERVLELNASDERGIQVIRDKVKKFAQRTASGIRPDGKPCPAFKIIILDEADSMTGAAQAALRRTMEKETKSTRFCLICNYVSRIIDPLTSRCSKFRFKPLERGIVLERLKSICHSENVSVDESALESLVDIAEGDMRRTITFLQSVSTLKTGDKVSVEDIDEITGRIPERHINRLFEVCATASFEKLQRFIEDFTCEGYSVSQLQNQVFERIIDLPEITDKQKAMICERLALSDFRLADGADEYLQMLDIGCTIMKALCEAE
ncbi:replication factor C subunit 4-like [Artemia franciscana]|uniref:Replication factor C subunit 2 n=1 Tax=Artemia franciscana TaxID=6661 RepID=A0AA88I206_ARTSF|nr:hypothetical protein QYM36_005163 [Artemia franciscana]